MKTEVRPARLAEKDIVANLLNLYQYDFTDFGGDPVPERGRFVYKYLDSYWAEKDRHPFLIYENDEIAGFCFVSQRSLLANPHVHSIAEFFILRYMRNRNIGATAAKEVIRLFPGPWEISQTYQNTGAQKFWLKVVESLVGEKFERIDLKDAKKIVLQFEY